ncbi:hypothetical protein L3Q82_022748 [Scortum barcoo]|uniref:Uncharacterized protein n=1 Tax=Scortum barcoo TaxID=214431 RepID=A0ACB8WWY9_9TELE|nr:hypothetical protein L3Q82_022748 [Scortum barcoo]
MLPRAARGVGQEMGLKVLVNVGPLGDSTAQRASLLLGASIGVSWNREDGPSRVTALATLILLICMIVITYALAKLLMLSELGPLTQRPWLLSLICWTCVSSLGVMLPWRLLGEGGVQLNKQS